ncbi:GNAT family N-acetyltransferase [Kutzneria kofuensis]|uniref:Ribosomal protein S18 acetylase RimI-like enzyme n=1 Tax=Kutzneria kofuensis TaxID=103725 RepID=A0A7W9KB29_9PSEU|nr:GNAT family N-acetyltransferase [Kutzneria kofuensis]MBB5889240.1 ribosomal protein S18 acetylase RimI-like enzyme [Kutzneria kofuensis]
MAILLFNDAPIRTAVPGDEDVVLDLLAGAASWLRGRGIEQWPERFPMESVRDQIAAGEALLVGDPAVASVVVTDSEPELWGDNAVPAYYISRLVVAREAAGRGLGYRILDWVQAAAFAKGWRYVRLAASKDNPGLRRYYEKAGFMHVGDPEDARWPTSLYERYR